MMMKNDIISGIYLVTNKTTGQMYVGQSTDIHRRFREHRRADKLGHSHIDNAINKHGAENFSFEIIMTIENDTEKLNDAEREWIAILNTYEDDFHYNLTPGGDFCPMKIPEIAAKVSEAHKGKIHTEEAKAKISKSVSGKNHPMYGKKHTQESREKMSEALSGENHPNYGKKFSEDRRKKISKAQNTTGYYRVYKQKRTDYKKGFRYVYQYYDDDKKRHEISSVDIKKLEKKIKDKGLLWLKFDNDDDNIFKIQESNKILYKIEGMRPTGHFYSTSKDSNLDIHQVLKTKHRVLDKDITIGKAKQIATDIGVSYNVLQRIAYNLTAGTFDEYIADWKSRLANTL